ncbi:MAG TPA: PAS domain S-box protein [Candidatus Angelobacter sp.]|nr:PAS domain S-box protein [Candidatus Angelobacter sp.]
MPMYAFQALFSSESLMPHGFCYQWNPFLIWLHGISDTLIAIAYFSIPPSLIYFVRKKRNIPFDWMFVCFGVFIAACGATHFMEVITLWFPVYWFSGAVKVITALASLPTAILLARVVPRALELPTAQEMQRAHEELKIQATILAEQTALIDLSQDAILVRTIEGKNLFWNQGAERMYGWTKAEALGENAYKLLETTFSQPLPEILEKLERTGYWEGELRKNRRDGKTILVSSRWALGRSPQGRPEKILMIDTDITEQRRSEAAMRESEDRYRDLVEHSHDLICTHDLQGRLLSVNVMPAKILGYSQDELINKPMKDFLVPEGHASFDEYLSSIQRTGFAKGALAVLTKSGERRIWEYQNSLRTDGVAEPVVRGIAHDVTEQRLVERALRRSEERFRLMADNIDEIFWLLDPKSLGIIYVSPAFEHICERPIASVYADPTSYREIIHPEDAPHVLAQLALLEKTNEFHEQFRIVCPSGAVKWVEVWGFTAKDGAGKVTALVGTTQDITKRKQTEEAFRRSEELLHAAFDQVAVGFSMTDLQGRFMKVNEAYCRITGYSEQELLSTNYQAITHPQDLPENLELAMSLVAGRTKSMVYEKRYIRKSGELVWVQNSVSAVSDSDGRISGFVALTEDITERKRAEDGVRRLSGHLLQLQDEERRRISRDLHDTTGQDLVAVASTLGNLLTTIPASNRKLRKSIAQCQALADRCIREVRTLSYVLHPPMLDEAGLADAIRHYVSGFAERTGIEVQLKLSVDFGRLAREEEMALFRVMQESLVNIHRHSGSFSASISLDHTPKGVLLEMKDKGRGMPGNGHGRGKTSWLAGGVGIQSMRERMKQVGGQLDIESSMRGTTVRATVPAHD